MFRPREGARYIVTGVPVVAEGLADAVQRSIFVLLGAALLVMAATLALVFRTRLRLLPLALALAAAAMTFGALSLAGGSLTMASIAVLPVLIGLAVDYAIQFQARFDEELARGGGARREAAAAAATAGGPTILTAGIATAVGFLVLLLSPVPMVRGFGAPARAGHRARAGLRALRRLRRAGPLRRPRERPPGAAAACRGVRKRRHPRAMGGCARVARRPRLARARRGARPPAPRARGRPRRSPWSAWRSTPRARSCRTCASSCPQDLQALKDVNALQKETGVSGEIDVTVRADDITDPAVVAWMTRFQDGVLRAHGYRPGQALRSGEGPARAVPGALAPRPVRHRERTGRARCAALLDAVPPYFSQGVVTRDRADRQPRLRHPPDAARAPEGGGGRHQAPARPARRRGGRGGRAAGARRGGERRAVVAVAARADAGRGAGRASSWCCSPSAARPAPPPCR